MSSNQIINQPHDYLCKKRQNESMLNYNINANYSEQKKPVHMFVLGSIPTKMGAHHFTHRHIDVESTLRGIRSTNMEGPSFHQEPIKKDFYTQDVFENHLKNSISVPPYILHHKNERTGFHNI